MIFIMVFIQTRMQWVYRRAPVLMLLGLFILAVGCYANTLPADLLGFWDDNTYVTENSLIRDLSLTGLRRIWTQFHFWQYIPVTLVSYALDYQLWGLRPLGYHLTNVLLHAVNGVLVYQLCCRLQQSWKVAGMAAVIFVVHPVQVETVAWVSERKNLLSLLFFLLAYLAHIRSRVAGSSRSMQWCTQGLAWGCYLLAVLAKPIVVAAPLLFIAYDFYWAAAGLQRSLVRNLPSLAIGLLGVGLTVLGGQESHSMKSYWGGSPWYTGLVMLRICWEYVVALAAPLHLNNLYLYALTMVSGTVQVWLGLGVLGLTGLCAWRQPLGQPLSLFAMLWVWVFFLPVANIVPFTVLRADRYLYFPGIMLFLLFGILVQRLWQWWASPSAHRAMASGLVGLLLLFVMLTLQRNAVWQNSETLWRHHLQNYPQSSKGLLNLGMHYHSQKDYERAVPFFRQLVSVAPHYLEGYRYLAQSTASTGRHSEALAVYQQALETWPQEKRLYNDMGYTYLLLGRYNEAMTAYKAAVALDPQYTLAQLHLGQAALRVPDYQLARDAFTTVLHQLPRHAVATGGLCQALSALAELDLAVDQCQQAVRLQPDNGYYLGELARVLLRLQRPKEALPVAQQAIAAAPQSALNYRMLGDVYTVLGEMNQASTAYRAALQLNPSDSLTQQRLERLQP